MCVPAWIGEFGMQASLDTKKPDKDVFKVLECTFKTRTFLLEKMQGFILGFEDFVWN
jgi:hypothetical protein